MKNHIAREITLVIFFTKEIFCCILRNISKCKDQSGKFDGWLVYGV
jgi:hypothetical protein